MKNNNISLFELDCENIIDHAYRKVFTEKQDLNNNLELKAKLMFAVEAKFPDFIDDISCKIIDIMNDTLCDLYGEPYN